MDKEGDREGLHRRAEAGCAGRGAVEAVGDDEPVALDMGLDAFASDDVLRAAGGLEHLPELGFMLTSLSIVSVDQPERAMP